MTAVMEVEQIRTAGALEALRPEWAALWSRAATATPFQRPEWLCAWWTSFEDGKQLRVLAIRDGGRLTGLLPLFAYGHGEAARAVLLGAGLSDYLDLLAEAPRAAAVTTALWGHLAADAADWPRLLLTDLPRGSPLLAVPAPARLRPRRRQHAVCPVLALPSSYDALEARLPSWLRRNLKQGRARLEKLGRPRWLRAEPTSLDPLLSALFSLHAERWEGRGEPGVLADPTVQSFHRRAARGLLEAGLLRMHALELDGRTVAVIYGLEAHGTVYHYISGFDPRLARCNPGALLLSRLLRAAVDEGVSACDLLRGEEGYKLAWGGRPTPSWSLQLL